MEKLTDFICINSSFYFLSIILGYSKCLCPDAFIFIMIYNKTAPLGTVLYDEYI